MQSPVNKTSLRLELRLKRIKKCSDMIFSALRIVLVVLLSESINGPLSNPVVLFFLVWIIRAASK